MTNIAPIRTGLHYSFYNGILFLGRLFSIIIVVDPDIISRKPFIYKRGEIIVEQGFKEGFAVLVVDIGSFQNVHLVFYIDIGNLCIC